MTPALLILGLGLHRQSPDPRVFLFDGEAVVLTMPTPSTDSTPSTAVANWPGWAGLAGPSPSFPTPFRGCGDWSGIEKAYLDNFGKPAVDWRLKIFILAKVDTLIQRKNGTWVDRRNELTGDRFVQTLNAIPQLIALVSAQTGGKVRIVPDVRIDPEPSRDTVPAGKEAFDTGYLTHYAEARMNGGLYQADDKKYRGPYDSVLFIDPCSRTDYRPSLRTVSVPFLVDDTPAAEVSFDNPQVGPSSDGLALALFDAWASTASMRAARRALPLSSASWQSADWSALASLSEVPTATLLSRLAASSTAKPGFLEMPSAPSQPVFKTSNIQLSIVKDPAKGDVLQYQESHMTRAGGVALPIEPGKIDLSKTPTLTVTYKTTSDQPVSLSVWGGTTELAGVKCVSLGRDPSPGARSTVSYPLQPDGAWHSVTIDLKALGIGTSIGRMDLGASPSASAMTTDLAAPVSYEFAEFRLGNDAPTPPLADSTPDASSSDPECRSLAAIEEGKKGQPSPTLAKLLSDSDNDVVLNALAAYGSVTDPAAEPKIIELSKSPSPRIAEFALKALQHQDTPTANAAITAALKFGFEYNREVAAGIIAQRHDPKTAQDLVVLLAGQLWHTRLAAAESLAQIPGPAADLMRLAILDQDDPEIKLAVIEHADPQSDMDMRKMLWEAVNEPSDAVRAASCEKLIQSTLPDMRTQGLKGVRDDSWWTRVLILRYLRDHPLEAARGAIKLALQDSSAKVRAEALSALGSLDQVSLDEIQGSLSDADPAVDKALIALAKRHKLTLPDATLEMFKKSPDPGVESAWSSS